MADTLPWSCDGGRSSSCSSSQSSENGSINFQKDFDTGFSSFNDYFGLSNLLSNVKISEDNPLMHSSKNLNLIQRTRRQSWGSDGSDNAAVLSPTLESQHNYDRFDMNNNNIAVDAKMLPPHNMRFNNRTNMRDHHIISGAYQQHGENRNNEKFPKTPLILPPSPTQPNPPAGPTLSMPPPSAPQVGSRGSSSSSNGVQVCVFCRNNGETESVYTSHVLKDSDGRTSCPILRAYTCPICKANGDNSHTIKYCPMNQNARMSNMMGGQQNNQQNVGFLPRPPFRAPPFPPPPNMPLGHPPFQQRNKNMFH